MAQEPLITIEAIRTDNLKSNEVNKLDTFFTSYQFIRIDLSSNTFKRIKDLSHKGIIFSLDGLQKRFHVNNVISIALRQKAINTPLTFESDNAESLTLNHNYLSGFIILNGENYVIQPLSDFIKNSKKDAFIIYPESAVIPIEGSCAITEVAKDHKHFLNQKMNSSGCETIKLAIANDHSMFTKYVNTQGVMNHNTAVINTMRPLFRSNFNNNIEFEIVDLFIPTSSGQDPFTSSTDVDDLIDDFYVWATNNSNPWGSISHDIGMLWSNRDFNGSTVGYAQTPNPASAYSRVYQILQDYTSNATNLRNLVAHELGHNLSAQHDSGGAPYIMAPAINSSSTWSPATISNINSRISTIGGSLVNCSCGESLTGPTLICRGETADMQIVITDGVGPYNVVYNDGTSNITLSNFTSGSTFTVSPTSTTTYEIVTIDDLGVNGFTYTCGSSMTHTIEVFDNAGAAQISGSTAPQIIEACDVSQSLALSSDITTLSIDQVIGWWITEDNPIGNTLTNANLTSQIAGATLSSNLTNPMNHLIESTSGSPKKNLTLDFDCSSLDATKNYYATPFVSKKKDLIADVQCIISIPEINGNITLNNYPANLHISNDQSVCRPNSPSNDPNFTYTITISNFSGNGNNHYIAVFSPTFELLTLSGNGTMSFDNSDFIYVTDPGLQDVEFWIWEEGGNGMQNATTTVSLDITYPGEPAITFPTIDDVNSCTIGAPIMISCSCMADECNSTVSLIDNMNKDVTPVITSSMELITQDTVDITISQAYWQAQQSVLLNPNFSVQLGSEFTVTVDNCITSE